MSDTKTPTPADVAEKTAATTEAPQTDAPAQETDWKAEARKWEQRAKENRTAAEKLAELEQAQMSEAERAAAKVKAAEDRAAELEARNNIAEVALDYGLSKDDAQLLKGVSDIETMRQIAERLANKGPRAQGRGHLALTLLSGKATLSPMTLTRSRGRSSVSNNY